jgi:hypothetical protein
MGGGPPGMGNIQQAARRAQGNQPTPMSNAIAPRTDMVGMQPRPGMRPRPIQGGPG